MRLSPDAHVASEDLERGKGALVRDAAWASVVGTLHGGVMLTGFALALGASPAQIGLLAALPFLAQTAQLPSIALVEWLRQRRKIALVSVSLSRLIIASLAGLVLLEDRASALHLLLAAQLAITLFGAVAGCAVNSWLHQLLATRGLGALFSKRLFWSTIVGAVGALAAGHAVQNWPGDDPMQGYALAFLAAGAAGFISVRYLSLVPEPRMTRTGPRTPLRALLRAPFADRNFRRLIVFMTAWNFASNLAAPFLAVYLLQQMGYAIGTVTALWIVGQLANALTMYSWGRLSDRLSNKAILAVALPVYFGSIVALPFAALPAQHALTLPLLYVIHLAMGVASGGISLATGNLGLKLAPQDKGTAYLAVVALAGAAAGGLASITGGLFAGWFKARQLSLFIHWAAPGEAGSIVVASLRHWEFLFGMAFVCGVYVLHALSRIDEGEEHSERLVIREFMAEASRSLAQFAPATLLFPIGRLRDRRLRAR